MKRFKQIILTLALILVSTITLVGCGFNEDEGTTTLTLTEAKSKVVEALKKETLSGNSVNRDVFYKFERSNTSVVRRTSMEGTVTTTNISVSLDKTAGNYSKLDATKTTTVGDSSSVYKEYADTSYYYVDDDGNKQTGEVTSLDDRLNDIYEGFSFLNQLFDDEAFVKLYNSSATQSTSASGYDIKLTSTILKYYEYTSGITYTDEDFEGLPDVFVKGVKAEMSVVVSFNSSDEITKVVVYIPNIQLGNDNAIFTDYHTITISKIATSITKPDWAENM